MSFRYYLDMVISETTPIDKIAIVGLGYVGLPLAVAFAQKAEVIGFDISVERIWESMNLS